MNPATHTNSTVNEFSDLAGVRYTRIHGGVWSANGKRIALLGAIDASDNHAFSTICDEVLRDDKELEMQLRSGHVSGLRTGIPVRLRPDKLLVPIGYHLPPAATPLLDELVHMKLPSHARIYIGAQVDADSVNIYAQRASVVDLIGTRANDEERVRRSQKAYSTSAQTYVNHCAL